MVTSTDANELLQQGITAARAGDRLRASELLQGALELDEQNEQAWLWLSGVVDEPADQITCLENVLTINPGNERAAAGLRYLQSQHPETATAVSEMAATPARASSHSAPSFGNAPAASPFASPPAATTYNGNGASASPFASPPPPAFGNDGPSASPFASPASPFGNPPAAVPLANDSFGSNSQPLSGSPDSFATRLNSAQLGDSRFGSGRLDTGSVSDDDNLPGQRQISDRLTAMPGSPGPSSSFDALRSSLFGGAAASLEEPQPASNPRRDPDDEQPTSESDLSLADFGPAGGRPSDPFSSGRPSDSLTGGQGFGPPINPIFAPTPPSPFGPPAEQGNDGVFGGMVNRPFGGAANFEAAREIPLPPSGGLAARAGITDASFSPVATPPPANPALEPLGVADILQPSSPLLIARPPIASAASASLERLAATFPCPNCRQPAPENALSCPNCRFQFYARCPNCSEYVDTTVQHDPRGDRCPNCQMPVDILELGRGSTTGKLDGHGSGGGNRTSRPRFGDAKEGQTLLAPLSPVKPSGAKRAASAVSTLIRTVIGLAIIVGLVYLLYNAAFTIFPGFADWQKQNLSFLDGVPRFQWLEWIGEQYRNITNQKPAATPDATPGATPTGSLRELLTAAFYTAGGRA